MSKSIIQHESALITTFDADPYLRSMNFLPSMGAGIQRPTCARLKPNRRVSKRPRLGPHDV